MDVPGPVCHLVYISFLSAAVGTWPEGVLGGPPYNLQMESHNFQHVLSWQAGSDPAVPASYNVLYREHRNENWTAASQCSGTAQLSCDLTGEFKPCYSQYYTLVQSITGTEVLNSSTLWFEPFTGTFLGPPEVNVSSCLNCINVTIKLPTSHFREKGKLLTLIDIYKELEYEITLKSQDGEHKRPGEKTTETVFSTVIEELYPSRNYCVSVVVTASLNKNSIPSAWKCVPGNSVAPPGYHMAAVAGAVGLSLLIAGALKCLHVGGYFLQNKSLPRALASIKRWVYLPWILELARVDSVEILAREAKGGAGVWGGSASEDSEDSDSSAPCAHDYTRRAVLGRAPQPPRTPSTAGQGSGGSCCGHRGSQAGDSPAAQPQEHSTEPEGDTGTASLPPSPEGSCSCPEGPSRACFAINLHSVLLGGLGQGKESPAAPPAPGLAGHWPYAHGWGAQEGTDSGQRALCRRGFQEWATPCASSEESDSSESDVDQVTGYMRR